jgi:hypothetical protein
MSLTAKPPQCSRPGCYWRYGVFLKEEDRVTHDDFYHRNQHLDVTTGALVDEFDEDNKLTCARCLLRFFHTLPVSAISLRSIPRSIHVQYLLNSNPSFLWNSLTPPLHFLLQSCTIPFQALLQCLSDSSTIPLPVLYNSVSLLSAIPFQVCKQFHFNFFGLPLHFPSNSLLIALQCPEDSS